MCDFETLVSLDTNLDCDGRECLVDTVKVVEVVPGAYYEYIPAPCVHLPFYEDGAKIFSGKTYNLAMCGNKKIPSALSTCCGVYTDRQPNARGLSNYGDILSEYRDEKLTHAGNRARCQDWGREECDPIYLGREDGFQGHLLHRQSAKDIHTDSKRIQRYNNYHWTTASCAIQVKVQSDGLIGK